MQTFFIILGVVGIGLILYYLFTYKKDSGNLDERIDKVQSKTSKDMNRLAAWRETKASEARTKLDVALANEVVATYNLDSTPDRTKRAERHELAQHQNAMLITEEATRQKISPTTYESIKLEEGLAQIRLLEAEGLKNLDWEFLEKEHQLKLRGALILAIKEHRELEGLTEMFETLVRRKHQIEIGEDAPAVKQKLLERYDNNITILDGVINAKGNRLLKEMDGEES